MSGQELIHGGDRTDRPPNKPTLVTIFTMIFTIRKRAFAI